MKYILPRDRTIASVSGHCIAFKKGVATHVPHDAVKEVVAAGAVPETEVDDPETKPSTPLTDAERELLLTAAIEEVATKNQREDFTASGAPHAKVLSDKCGFQITSQERDAAWHKFQTKGT